MNAYIIEKKEAIDIVRNHFGRVKYIYIPGTSSKEKTGILIDKSGYVIEVDQYRHNAYWPNIDPNLIIEAIEINPEIERKAREYLNALEKEIIAESGFRTTFFTNLEMGMLNKIT